MRQHGSDTKEAPFKHAASICALKGAIASLSSQCLCFYLLSLQWTSGWCFQTPTLTTSSALRSVTLPPVNFVTMRGSGQRLLSSSYN